MKGKTPSSINIKRVDPKATDIDPPALQSEGAGGYDIHAAVEESVSVPPGGFVHVPTGFAWEIPSGCVGILTLRSGRARGGLILANGTGIIDSDYRGEVIMIVRNLRDEDTVIARNSRIGQMVIVPCLGVGLKEVEELSNTARGEGGFGSTDGPDSAGN